MEYIVINAADLKELIVKVNDLIAQGWKPQGGISVSWFDCAGDLTAWHYQAMVRISLAA